MAAPLHQATSVSSSLLASDAVSTCALVLPVTADGQVALIRAWRVAVRRWCREAPSARIEPAEHPADAARRELREEIGGECTDLVSLGQVFRSSGSSNERVHLFVGCGLRIGRPAWTRTSGSAWS